MNLPQSEDTDKHPALAVPRVHPRTGPSLVWLIPLVTVLIGAWLIFKTVEERGPQITLAFQTAEGIEPGTTRIKFKNVEVGVVESLRFSENHAHVLLGAQMNKEAESLLNRGSRFWVVRPRLSLREVSGLGTLISGAYIELDPGEGAAQRHFVGLETPPVLTTQDDGTKVLLMAPRLGSIGIGSPIYYQGIHAGEVLGYELGDDQTSVLVHAFVKAPYDDLVQGNTRFWNVSGIDVRLDADGLKVRTESLESLMFGGIAFETPASLEPVGKDVAGLVFSLHPSYESVEEQAYVQKVQFVLFFEGSVRGLSLGAPVEFKGIKVGAVRDIRLEFHADDTSFRIPVLVELEPERVLRRGEGKSVAAAETLQLLIQRGLRARLKTGSLLTGQLFVELLMLPESPIRLVGEGLSIPEFPTVPADLDELTQSVKGFLAKLDKVELDKIASELHGSLQGTNQLLNHAKLEPILADMSAAMHHLKGILASLDKRSEPIGEGLETALTAVAPALQQARTTMALMDGVLAPESQLHYRVLQMIDELSETARSIRVFVDLLERNPDAMIFGKSPPR